MSDVTRVGDVSTPDGAIVQSAPPAGAASISDIAYAASWNGVTDVAPSKNAVYDKIETLAAGSGHTIKDETISLAARTNLNFTGAGVVATDNAGTNSTDVTIAGGGGSPGGSDTQLQYNNAGAFGGTSGLTWDGTHVTLAGTQTFKFRDANTQINAPSVGTLILKGSVGVGLRCGYFGIESFDQVRVLLYVPDVALAENYLEIDAAVAGSPVVLKPATIGADLNIGVNVVPLGTGRLQVNAVNVPTISSTDTLTNKTIDASQLVDATVTLAKMANLAQDQFIGRVTASTGVPETATITAAARTVLDDITVAAMVDTLGGVASTGTGGLVRATSPTLVTPLLGTPTSGVLTNCTGLPVAGGGTGVSTIAALSIWLANSANVITSVTPGAGNSIRINAGGTAWEAYTPGVGGSNPFADDTAIIKGSVDATKLLRIEVDGFTTATTRVMTPPNADITIAGINLAQTWTADQTLGTTNRLYLADANCSLHSTSSGNATLAASTLLTLGVAGDISLGDGTLRIIAPQTTLKIDLGSASKYFGDLRCTTATITGAVSLNSTLVVTGTSTLGVTNTGALTVTGAATVSTTLGVTGATTLSSTVATGALTVTGAATVSTTLGVTGTSTLGVTNTGALGVTGAITATTSIAATTGLSGASLAIWQTALGTEVATFRSTATNDDVQEALYQNRLATTDGTANQTLHTFAIPTSTTVMIEVWVVAKRSTTETGAAYRIINAYKNVAGTVTALTAVTADGFAVEDVAGWDCNLAISGTNVLCRVTGAASSNITWHMTARVWMVST